MRDALVLFGRLVRLSRPYWGRLAKGMWLGLVVGFIGMATPWISKLLIDEAYPAGDFGLMHVLVGAGLAIAAATAMTGAIRGYYTQVVSAQLGSAAGLMFFNQVQHLSSRFFEQHRVGEILSRFQDLRRALGTMSGVMETVFVRGAYLLFVPPLLFVLNWRLAFLALVTVPLSVTVSALASRGLRRRWKASAEADADLTATHFEALSHIRTIKGLAAERLIYARTKDQVERALGLRLRAGAFGTVLAATTALLRTGGTALLALYAWTLILRGDLTLGEYIAFMAYLSYLTGPVHKFVSLVSEFQQVAVALSRLFEYLDEQPELDPISATTATSAGRALNGRIELREVSFEYSPVQRVLHDVSLGVEAGSVSAIVGPSGSGKSTLLKLISGFERAGRGVVSYDGRPLASVGLAELRRQVTVVWQDASLLQGTLWDNLTLGAPDACADDVDHVARICRLDEIIGELPGGYESLVAEWGNSLSGGQRQRVSIARALLTRTPVLLLDEAMSNIDSETEVAILHDIIAHREGRTILYVTHRVSTAQLADEVCVLSDGRLLAMGPHSELMRDCEPYARMHASEARVEAALELKLVHPAGPGYR